MFGEAEDEICWEKVVHQQKKRNCGMSFDPKWTKLEESIVTTYSRGSSKDEPVWSAKSRDRAKSLDRAKKRLSQAKERLKCHENQGHRRSNRRLVVFQRANISEQRFPRNSKNGLVGVQKWTGRLPGEELLKFNANRGARSGCKVQCSPQISKDFKRWFSSNGK